MSGQALHPFLRPPARSLTCCGGRCVGLVARDAEAAERTLLPAQVRGSPCGAWLAEEFLPRRLPSDPAGWWSGKPPSLPSWPGCAEPAASVSAERVACEHRLRFAGAVRVASSCPDKPLDPQDVRVEVLARRERSASARGGRWRGTRAGAGTTCGPHMVPNRRAQIRASSASLIIGQRLEWRLGPAPSRRDTPRASAPVHNIRPGAPGGGLDLTVASPPPDVPRQ
jgi:hypothetical protein